MIIVSNMSDSKPKTIKCYCSSCGQRTNHWVVSEVSLFPDDRDDFWWRDDYRLVRCCGCERISFNREYVDESMVDYDPHNGSPILVSEFTSFPNKEGLVEPVENTWDFPSDVYGIYKEAITAYNEGCLRLAAAGFRATVEAICNDKGIVSKNLESKINGLKRAGIITDADRNRLHSIRFMGNDSIHEMKAPDKNSVKLVMEIINGILTNLYIIEEKSKEALEAPINNWNDFASLLDEGLSSRSVGETDVLKNFIPSNRRLIKEDLSSFEAELKQKIASGEYIKLSMAPIPPSGRNQQYRIESL